MVSLAFTGLVSPPGPDTLDVPELTLSLVNSVLVLHTPSMNLGGILCNDYIEASGSQVCYLILHLELQPLTSSWALCRCIKVSMLHETPV